jgi:hypothetical protein
MLGLYASLAYRQWFKYLMWTSAVKSHDKKRIRLCDGTVHLCNKHYDAIVETPNLFANSDSSVYHNFLQIFILDLSDYYLCSRNFKGQQLEGAVSFFEKSLIAQLVKKFNAFHKRYSLASVLCQMSSFHILL